MGLPEIRAARPDLAGILEAADALFPVRVTRSWWRRMREGDPDDPLALQVLPTADELVADAGDLQDPVGEKERVPVPWVVRKHSDRVLLLLTKRCHLYCRYCFRRTHAPGEGDDPSPEEWEHAVAFVAGCGAREAILSGGDPLAVRDARLFDTIDRLKAGQVTRIRVHTRAPITAPWRVTDALVAGLAARPPVWVVVHANHADELSPEVDVALARMTDAGIPVLNQSVLLAGVNDDADTLAALSEALLQRRVKPYYLHHTDHVAGNASFRVDPHRGLRIHAELATKISGIGLPAYVIDPPDGTGKVPVATWLALAGQPAVR